MPRAAAASRSRPKPVTPPPDEILTRYDGQSVEIPASACTLAGFREWAKSDDFPERGRFSFIGQRIFIDMSPEELETHNRVKGELYYGLTALNREIQRGVLYTDGTLVTNEEAGLSTEPDGTFVLWESLESGRVRMVPRADEDGQYVELEGTPDLVVEVVSRSSVAKDTRHLRQAYYLAGIPEYWLIDARRSDVDFQILRRRSAGYTATPVRQGWVRSRVFGRGFRLERQRGRMNLWQYTLRVQPTG
jgi:Uma2 family endonuclease